MELNTKKTTSLEGFIRLIGFIIFIVGIINGNWFMLIGGFLWNFDSFNLFHYKGKELS